LCLEIQSDFSPQKNITSAVFQCYESLKGHTLKYFFTDPWHFVIAKTHRSNPLYRQALVAHLIMHLHKAIIRLTILTPFLSSSIPEPMLFAIFAGKASYVLSSSVL
jgi:hypothetical protein